MQYRRAIFELFLCLSLANLLFLRVWAQLLPAVVNRANLYYMEQAPHWIHYPAVLVSLLVVGGAASATLQWARRSSRTWATPVARTVLLILFLAASNAVRGQIPEPLQEEFLATLTPPGVVALGVVSLSLLAWFLRYRSAFVFAAIEVFAIFAAPFLLMTIGQAGWAWSHYERDRFAGGSLAAGELAAPFLPGSEAPMRVIWILFDELDQHAAFDARPTFLALPEFDRLAKQSFVGTNAFAPAGETRRSVASILLGKQVAWAMPSGAAALPCAVAEGNETTESSDCWTRYPNLFDILRASGINSAVAGWYHPYCRLFALSLARCAWSGLPYWDSSRIGDSFGQQWEEVVKAIPVARNWLRPGARIRRAHANSYSAIRRAALSIAVDPSIGFALLHFPVPHHPDIYDRGRAVISIDDRRSYFDNLELADRTLGEVREEMESAGLWDGATVVVTSDHWWRAIHRGDWGLQPEEEEVFADEMNRRIPFFLKFSGQRNPASYAKPFNTILLHDLTQEIFAGRIATPAAAAIWLDGARLRAPVPYLKPEHVLRANRSRFIR